MTTARNQSVAVARVGTDRLRFHPRNVRTDLGDLRSLTASITAHGVLCPLMAYRCGEFLQLLHGHRRLAAARLAGLRAVPVLVVDPHDDDEALSLMLAENLQRAGLRRADRRAALQALVNEFGHTFSGIAGRLGVTAETVRKWAANEDEAAEQMAARRRGRRRRVYGATLQRLANTWAERAGGGLSADQASQLLAEIRALAEPTADTTTATVEGVAA